MKAKKPKRLSDQSLPDIMPSDAMLLDTTLPDVTLLDTTLPNVSLPDVSLPDVSLTDGDHELIAAANAALKHHYRPFWHMVGAAIRSCDGRIWTGLHIGTTVGRLSVCAEAVAFGRALLDGDGTIHTAVAVRHPKPEEENRELAVVSPCGACREMIMDHAPTAMVIVMDASGLIKLPIRTLLPMPYRR